ncbi:glyceraldehyde-3-phosphate dehydrogenase [Vibrio sp. SCSIO 43133]|uniref:glyceraldehyde-3-phosphate dehydrogenase n=1 Tax=Vibrio sp. SCSIO 43133 TaxID=2802577 RepID=UPI0020762B13|nr:glyceraldehyde-3-phosphate dehydrogenase [Vibrio sp. SCSIO 43133]USE02759.1 glyceraldehyde-3-phosphate dehydrogenase [Vibrio sp. SCSIO 43133]
MRASLSIIVLTVSIASSQTVATSFTDPVDHQFDMGEYLAENAYGFLPVPILVTEPAVGYGGGVMGVFLHESEAQKEKRRKLSMTSVNGGAQLLTPAITVGGAFGTDNGTWAGFVGHRHSWKRDSIRYLGGAFYGDVNMDFYGSGEHVSKFELNMKGYGELQKLQFRVADTPLLLGISQAFVQSTLSLNSIERQQDRHRREFHPSLDSTFSMLGLLVEHDTRNSFLYPSAGGDYSGEYRLFRKSLGSDYDFDTFTFKGIHYFPIREAWNLGFKGQYNTLSTSERYLPTPVYPDINMRGIARERYQGDTTASLETQLTWQMTMRWSASVFGGLGTAVDDGDSIFTTNNHYSYGVGFRYLIARRYGLRAGIDVATSESDNAIYFQVGTGF